jgi:hypothetical protein
MKKRIFVNIIGFSVISGLSVLSHFTFEWLNHSRYIAIFVPVNESIFEHLKLLFYPYIIWSIIFYLIYPKRKCNYFWAQILAVLIGLLFIVVSFYTYSGILGYDITFVDISIFFISVILTMYFANKFTCALPFGDKMKFFISVILFLTIIAFIIYTFTPPHINFFKDPSNGLYGLS